MLRAGAGQRLLAAALCVPAVALNPNPGDPMPPAAESASQWKRLARLTARERYFIPLNPEGWALEHNSRRLARVVGPQAIGEDGGEFAGVAQRVEAPGLKVGA